MRQLTITILLLLLVSVFAFALLTHSTIGKNPIKLNALPSKNSNSFNKEISVLQTKATVAKNFVQQKGFNQQLCFLIDMNLPANRKRFFVYDLEKDSIINSGLVTHGNCNQYWLEGRKYSNEVGCGCTSLGKYKVGYSYQGRFGLAFKLYGLESSNSNAFNRYVVLHSHSCVPDNEIEEDICQSNGCPTVAPSFLKELEPIIKASKQPILLWIFDEKK